MCKKTNGITKKASENSKTVHQADFYTLIVGFEVNHNYKENNPKEKNSKENNREVYRDVLSIAGKRKAHFALEDSGHTFMYLTKNNYITIFFSLGPKHRESNKQRAFGEGTPDYHIPEKTRLFRFLFNKSSYDKMYEKAKQYRKDVFSKEKYYNILNNYTCASATRDIIKAGWENVPSGKSYVAVKMNDSLAGGIPAVNPYAFYEDMKSSYPNALCAPDIRAANEKRWDKIMEDTRKGLMPYDPSFELWK